jgi:hypothetical protein
MIKFIQLPIYPPLYSYFSASLVKASLRRDKSFLQALLKNLTPDRRELYPGLLFEKQYMFQRVFICGGKICSFDSGAPDLNSRNIVRSHYTALLHPLSLADRKIRRGVQFSELSATPLAWHLPLYAEA